jgi:hypothetical protein
VSAQLEIHAGDVLLFHGHSFVSWAIRWFDGADVDHAAIALGPESMGQAVDSGLREDPIAAAVKGNDRTYLLRLPTTTDMAPVVGTARELLSNGVPYAYQELVLLGALSLSRRLPANNHVLRAIIRKTLDGATELLSSLVGRGNHLMIASEYVYRCYDEAGNPAFHLAIGTTAAAAAPHEDGTLLAWMRGRPDPPAESAIVSGTTRDPADIAARVGAELEPMIAELAEEQSPREAEALAPFPASAAPVATAVVSDDQLHGSAVSFRNAFNATRVGSIGSALTSGPAWDLFQTVSNVVTPGDLARCTSLVTVSTADG